MSEWALGLNSSDDILDRFFGSARPSGTELRPFEERLKKALDVVDQAWPGRG